MILLIGGEKGGTGKSTLVTNLAAVLAGKGVDVLLVDADPQGSSQNWAAVRTQCANLPRVHCVEKTGEVGDAARDLSRRYGQVIIDAGGRDSQELRSAMLAADVMVIPVKASQFDLWTISTMDLLVQRARTFNRNLGALALLSMAPTNPSINEAEGAKELLVEYKHLHLASTKICERKAYRDALTSGRGVVEMPNLKAVSELQSLAQEIYG